MELLISSNRSPGESARFIMEGARTFLLARYGAQPAWRRLEDLLVEDKQCLHSLTPSGGSD